jgi:thiol-disulfide isomerase/thioredoxin
MKYFILLTTLCVHSFRIQAKDANEITQKHLKPLVKELSTYIEKNPDAEDLNEATETALQIANILEDNETISILLMNAYHRELDRGQLDSQALAIAGVMAAQFAIEQGDKATAREIHTELKKISDMYMDPSLMKAANHLQGLLATPAIGDAPTLAGKTLTGENITLDQFKGKVVMIDFWATWCGPCVAELPNVKRTYDKYHEQGFEIIGVSLDRDKAALEAFIEKKEMNWSHLYDPEQTSSLASQFAVKSIPTILLIDRNGKIASINARGPELEVEVARLIEQKAAE